MDNSRLIFVMITELPDIEACEVRVVGNSELPRIRFHYLRHTRAHIFWQRHSSEGAGEGLGLSGVTLDYGLLGMQEDAASRVDEAL